MVPCTATLDVDQATVWHLSALLNTGYRYLHEGIDVPADQAPDLRRILDRCLHQGMAHTILDGTLITTDRITGVRENGNDLWFSQKHKAFGGNLQFLSAPNGTPLGVSDAEPGSTSDITAARIHALPALYKAAAQGLPVLADKGYQGTGIGVRTPIKRPTGKSEGALHVNTRMYKTHCCGTSVRSVSAPQPNSRSAGVRSNTSR